jgi:hypothetical protein
MSSGAKGPDGTTDVERWNHAVRIAFDEDPGELDDETDAMSDAEVEADLRAAGVDTDAFHAKMDALYKQYIAGAAPSERPAAKAPETDEGAWTKGEMPRSVPGKPRKEGRGRHVVAYAAVAAAATAGVATYLATRPPPETPDVKPKDAEAPKPPKPAPSATPVVDVTKLRAEALAACARGEYEECLNGLDQAKDADPAGDVDPRIQAARKKANDARAARGGKEK